MAEEANKTGETSPAEIIDSYENGAKKETFRKVTLDGEEWKIAESFSENGIRSQLMQVSSTGIPVRKITYDQQGRAIEIFMPQASRYEPAFALTLDPENGLPKSIVLESKIFNQTFHGTFKDGTTLVLSSTSDVKQQITLSKELNLNDPDSTGVGILKGKSGLFKGAISRAHMQVSGVDIGIPESPIYFSVLSMYPTGRGKHAKGLTESENGEPKYPLHLHLDENGDYQYTKTIEPKRHVLRQFTHDYSPETGEASNRILLDSIIATPEGVIKEYKHFHLNQEVMYRCNFRQQGEPAQTVVDYEHFDENRNLLFQINDIPLAAIYNTDQEFNLTPEQEYAKHLLNYSLKRGFSPIRNRFFPDELPLSEITLAQDVKPPLERLKKIWKEPKGIQKVTYKADYDGSPADAVMYYKDKSRAHFIQYKPDGKPFRQIWYDEAGTPNQIDCFLSSKKPDISFLLDHKLRTEAVIDGIDKTVYRFDQHPEVLTVEHYKDFLKPAESSKEHAAFVWNIILGDRIAMTSALAETELPGVDLGLKNDGQDQVLNVFPNGIHKTTRYQEHKEDPVYSVYSEDGKPLLHLTQKPKANALSFYDDGGKILGECNLKEDGTQDIKWFQKPKMGDEKPVLQTRIEINNKGHFVAKNYGADGKVTTQTKSLPVQKLFGRLTQEDHPAGSALVQIPDKLKEMYREALKELNNFNQYEAKKQGLAEENSKVPIPEPDKPNRKTRPDGSLRQERVEDCNNITNIYYWKDAGKWPVVRTKLYYKKDHTSDTRAYIHMMPVRDEEKKDPQKLDIAKDFAIECAIEDFVSIKDIQCSDIILDFHEVKELHDIHYDVIKAIQSEVANEKKGRKIKITGIDSNNKEALKAIKEKFKTKDEADKIVVLPSHYSQDPNVFDEGIPERREEYDMKGNLVFTQYYDENGRSTKVVKVNNRGAEIPILDSNMSREFIPYDNLDISLRAIKIGR